MLRTRIRKLAQQFTGRDNERGVALIMSLGVLAMVSLMAVAFATTALFSQNMATLSREIVQARLHSEAAAQRIHGILNVELADPNNRRNLFPPTRKGIPDHFGPTTASSAWNGRTYWCSTSSDTDGVRDALALNMAGVDFTPDASNAMLDAKVGWEAVLDSATGELKARYCFVVIDESGKVDPNKVIKKGVIEGYETPTRMGNSVTDYNLAAAAPTIGSKFQFSGDGDGELPTNLQWLSYFHIFKTHSTSVANARTVLDDVIFPRSYDLRAWHNSDKDKHRFNLKGANWDIFNNSVSSSKLTVVASDFWSGTSIAANTGGIEWLANATDPLLRDQVAANLIDYCDSDSIPTTDDITAPTYLGIEALPFFNEFIVQFLLYDDLATIKPDYYLDISLWTELINMWPDPSGAGGTIEVDVTIESPDIKTSPLTFTKTWSTATDIPAQTYHTLTSQLHTESLGNTTSLADLTVTITEARYTDAAKTQLWDFARTVSSPITPLVPLIPHWVNVEADDPRQNHETADWTWTTGVVGGTDGTTNLALNLAPVTPHDQETGAIEPWEVSTAYIRNASMETLWELGAIHRGKAWQTLNLKSFNESSLHTVGMDTYSLGDANILAQVKLTSDNYHHGAINLNSNHPGVLNGMLIGLSIGDSYETPTGSLTLINLAQAQSIVGTSAVSSTVGQWLYENGSAGVIVPMHNRGGLARIKTLSDGSVLPQLSDMAREEVIGKIAGIGSVRSNFFTVLLTTQTVRDLPTGVKGGILGQYDAGVDRILAEQRVFYHMYRDALNNKFRIIHFEYIDL
jgi:hypothetical protein